MADDNKRDNERVPIPSPLHGEVKVFQPMTILDVSHGGAQIETPFALQLHSLHDFKITLGDRSIVVKGRIAHCHIGELQDGGVLYPHRRRVHREFRARAGRAGDLHRGTEGRHSLPGCG